MTARVYNFSAGPAMLPEEVLKQAQTELLDWHNTGMSIAEVSHRSKSFLTVAEQSEQDCRDLLAIPDDYHVLFLPGGSRTQFAAVPMNLAGENPRAAYVNTGVWSAFSSQEASQFCQVDLVADTKESGYRSLVPQSEWQDFSAAAYLHYVDNETVNGVEYQHIPDTGEVPLVADMSSSLLSKPLDISRFGVIYACAQKNLGISGVTVVIVKDALLKRQAMQPIPSMLDYRIQSKKKSLLNTAPTFPWYITGLIFQWVKQQGGVTEMAARAARRSSQLYDYINESPFYQCDVDVNARSKMNVVFRCPTAEQDADFVTAAAKQGLLSLKGHRIVGGIRASIYNAMPEAAIDTLVDFMHGFAK